jgi:hypothetical protein
MKQDRAAASRSPTCGFVTRKRRSLGQPFRANHLAMTPVEAPDLEPGEPPRDAGESPARRLIDESSSVPKPSDEPIRSRVFQPMSTVRADRKPASLTSSISRSP